MYYFDQNSSWMYILVILEAIKFIWSDQNIVYLGKNWFLFTNAFLYYIQPVHFLITYQH